MYNRAVFGTRRIIKCTTPNMVDLERYSAFSEISHEQQEKICDLLNETVVDTIYHFLEIMKNIV